MRSLGEIAEDVRSGARPPYEELRYAVIAYQALLTFDNMALMKLAETERENKPRLLTRSAVFQWKEYFNRVKRALEKSPKDWVGWENDPDNPEFQKRRKISEKLFEAAAQRADQRGEPSS